MTATTQPTVMTTMLKPAQTLVTICRTCAPLIDQSFKPTRENGQWVDIADLPYTVVLERMTRAENVAEAVATISDHVGHTCYVCGNSRRWGVIGVLKAR